MMAANRAGRRAAAERSGGATGGADEEVTEGVAEMGVTVAACGGQVTRRHRRQNSSRHYDTVGAEERGYRSVPTARPAEVETDVHSRRRRERERRLAPTGTNKHDADGTQQGEPQHKRDPKHERSLGVHGEHTADRAGHDNMYNDDEEATKGAGQLRGRKMRAEERLGQGGASGRARVDDGRPRQAASRSRDRAAGWSIMGCEARGGSGDSGPSGLAESDDEAWEQSSRRDASTGGGDRVLAQGAASAAPAAARAWRG